MEPRIQYAKTVDGVSIAFWTMGEGGMPFVQMPLDLGLSHIQLEWQNPAARRWYERLAEKRMLVRYDPRGHGLSDRDVRDYSFEALLLDLEAVVDRLNLARFALAGSWTHGLVAVAYAARHPERVSHLILWCSATRISDLLEPRQIRALEALLDVDWETATETWARVLSGESEGAQARLTAAFLRESTTLEAIRGFIRARRDIDVRPLLPRLRSPTLVLSRRQFPTQDMVRLARDLASRIPDARLVVLEGASGAPLEDMEAVLAVIDEFLGEGEEAPAPETPPAAAVHTILFTDMESSSALRQRLGDTKAQELVRTHNAIVREALKAHGGSEIKHTGDGIMASFPTASGALECAVAIQRGVAAHVEQHPDAPLGVYIGLNAGEPIAEERDLFGTSVDLARRICDQAEAGQILVSDVVRQLATGKGFLFSDLGDVVPKGFEEPVKLWEVRWQEDD